MSTDRKGQNQETRVGMPGTLVLCLLFLAFFALMFVVNFTLLGRAWPVG
jgi:hypothetical protein